MERQRPHDQAADDEAGAELPLDEGCGFEVRGPVVEDDAGEQHESAEDPQGDRVAVHRPASCAFACAAAHRLQTRTSPSTSSTMWLSPRRYTSLRCSPQSDGCGAPGPVSAPRGSVT